MNKLISIIIPIAVFFNFGLDDFSIDVQLLNKVSVEKVSILVQVKKLSENPITILKSRNYTFKYDNINSFGNYIIEIEKWENNRFNLLSPSSDIGSSFNKEEYIILKKGENITDTLNIYGYSFSRNRTGKRGFPPGIYRLRVSFNSSEWSNSQTNSSRWLNFEINLN